MFRLLRFPSALLPLALLALVAGFTVGVPSASAVDPFPGQGITTLSSTHFTVHYDRDNLSSDCAARYITQQTAGDVLGMAERAYALFSSWGYPAPGYNVDISIDDFKSLACITLGPIDSSVPRDDDGTYKRWNALINPLGPGIGEIHLDAQQAVLVPAVYHTIAHEVFHLFELAETQQYDQWLGEGTAEWAAVRADGPGVIGSVTGRSADCVGSECTTAADAAAADQTHAEADRAGYPDWLLFEYLAERFGDGAVKEVWGAAHTTPANPGTTDFDSVLQNRGTTLQTFFNDFATAGLTGNFTLAGLTGVLPSAPTSVATGSATGAIPTTNLAVNHLSVRYVALHHGAADADGTEPCYAATLALSVTIPAGVVSTPYYFANTAGATAQAMTVSGSTASLTVPWNTCSATPDAYLSLPNDTLKVDGSEFAVKGTVTVDLSSPANPFVPPGQAPVHGPVVQAPTSDDAPQLTLYAPELLRVNATTRALRFVVFSSGDGRLKALLGSASLGTATLQAGSNDVRFVLPKSLFNGLRRTSSTNLLQLTSLSPSGDAGMTVTRHVAVQKAKAKPKPKVKANAKKHKPKPKPKRQR